MHETSTAPPLAWSCAFPAAPAQARAARRSLARILDGHPAADDAVLCLGELAANATIHSRSRNGGHFTVRAQFGEGCVRVEVHDQGPVVLGRTSPVVRDLLGQKGIVIAAHGPD